MRRLSACLLAVLFATAAHPASSALAGERYAVLVAVKDYDEAELNSLLYTENDVTGLADVLKQAGYAEGNVVLLTQTAGNKKSRFSPFAKNIKQELDLVLAELGPGDSILVALSGHGVRFAGDKADYFCPADARLADKETLVSLSAVYQALEACQATSKVLLVDACRNEPQSKISKTAGEIKLDPVGTGELPAPPAGIAALFSCSPGEKSFEHPDVEHGVFLHFIIEGLKGAADQADEGEQADGQITLTELQAYSFRNVQRFIRQRVGKSQKPQIKGEINDLVLASLPEKPVTPPPPPDDVKPLEVIENSIGMKLVLIPAGEFQMGSPEGEEGHQVDETQHRVKLTKSFFLGQTEVTVGQFRRFVTDNGYKTEAETDGEGGCGFNAATGQFEGRDPKYNWQSTGITQTDDHPVVNVTWNDAQKFLKWLGGKEQAEYRLPTEAEWEYACRAGKTTRFSSGTQDTSLLAVANIADASLKAKYSDASWAQSWNDGYPFTSPVGSFDANPFKLVDMHGNVWEWCQDAYRADYDKLNASDPVNPDSGADRVIRGGSWSNHASPCRCAYRYHSSATDRTNNNGFRVGSSLLVRGSR